jgi:hypothetical protein
MNEEEVLQTLQVVRTNLQKLSEYPLVQPHKKQEFFDGLHKVIEQYKSWYEEGLEDIRALELQLEEQKLRFEAKLTAEQERADLNARLLEESEATNFTLHSALYTGELEGEAQVPDLPSHGNSYKRDVAYIDLVHDIENRRVKKE